MRGQKRLVRPAPDRHRIFQPHGPGSCQPDHAAALIALDDGDLDRSLARERLQIPRQRLLLHSGPIRERAERVVGRRGHLRHQPGLRHRETGVGHG